MVPLFIWLLSIMVAALMPAPDALPQSNDPMHRHSIAQRSQHFCAGGHVAKVMHPQVDTQFARPVQ